MNQIIPIPGTAPQPEINRLQQRNNPGLTEHHLDSEIVREFHRQYYQGGQDAKQPRGLHTQTYYHGIETHKCPLDLWIFQELLFRIRPSLVIELGTYRGGTTLFLAHQMDALGTGSVVSIDNRELSRPEHARIQYLLGNTRDRHIVADVSDRLARVEGPGLVIHDADHHFEEVLADLEIYQQFVSVNSYLIVEDTNVNGNPVLDEWGSGPREAVERFLQEHSNFESDLSCEKFLLTYNPGGYLRRTS